MSIQSATVNPEPQLLGASSEAQLNTSEAEVANKARVSAGSADREDLIIEQAKETNKTSKEVTDALSTNATLATALGFALGATDAAVMAEINEALAQLVDVDVSRRKVNREFTFLTADHVAAQMNESAEKERRGAIVALAFGLIGGSLSIGMGMGAVASGNSSATKTKLQNNQMQELEALHNKMTSPMKNTLKGPDGGIDVAKWSGKDAPKMYDSKATGGSDKTLNAREASQEMLGELQQWKEGKIFVKNQDGGWNKVGTKPDGTPQYQTKTFEQASPEELENTFGKTLGKLAKDDPEAMKSHMRGLQGKVDQEVRLRSLVTEQGENNGTDLVRGGKVDHEIDAGAAQKQLMNFDSKMAENGYQDQTITNQLREISRADANLTALTNISTVPGQMVSAAGNSAADLTYNKEAKELEAQAARDGATQSFFSDNAGTVSSEIQGAFQTIEAVKSYIEVGAGIASKI